MKQVQEYLLADAEVASLKWSKLWETRADRTRLLLVAYMGFVTQMCGNALISYYLTIILDTIGIKDTLHQTLVNGILQIYNFVIAISGALMVERVGRRRLWLFAISIMLISFILWTICSALFAQSGNSNHALAVSVLVFIFAFQLGYAFGITPLAFSYPAEILPFHARQKAMGLLIMCQNAALIYNNMVNPIAIDAIGWKYYLVFIAVLAQWLVVAYLFFPETKGYSLEELSDLFNRPIMQLRNHPQFLVQEVQVDEDNKNTTIVTQHIES
ncbi:hypothetical protein NKR23_g7849 [Pleurostoma richardsiae]|uniref:Major facilitator superfamily (MFS) profile domain-containing protein n=1 Tax=Pleurostoma richardsiae TaxID=41990 RepID=A0AA38RKK6_9PEZI|nr:hypothetical protein NKR23_g7849 [Pleurostoma richardsiae]